MRGVIGFLPIFAFMKESDFIKKNPLAMQYFKGLCKILKERGMDDVAYSNELSIIACEYSIYHNAVLEMNEKGTQMTYPTGAQAVGTWMTVRKDALSQIQKLTPKFGLTPVDFEKIKAHVVVKAKKEDKGFMSGLMD
jgi:phage terminase small subunit